MLVVGLVCAVLGAILWASDWALEQLRGQSRYEIAFQEIECDPPAGMNKQDFLDEVRFASRLPVRLSVLDEDLRSKLQEGSARHHRVAVVDEVVVQPPKQVIVKLTYRVPVLAVRLGDTLRAVDGDGVLLHSDTPTQGLPIYEGNARPPQGKTAGSPWGDPRVEAAARKLKKR